MRFWDGLDILNRQRKVPISIKEIRPRLEAVVTAAGVNDSEISLVFVQMLRLNGLTKSGEALMTPQIACPLQQTKAPIF